MNYNTQDRIDAYIRGEMNASERVSFTKELSQNMELRKDYEFTRNVANTISDRERKKRQIREWNQNSHKTVYLYSAITSIAAMLVIGFFIFNQTTNEKMIIQLEDDNVSVSSSVKYYGYTEIIQLISEEKYTIALSQIEKAEKNIFTTGIDTAQINIIHPSTDNIYELKWLKVQALLGLNKEEDAQTILKEILNSNSKYRENADSLWRSLQRKDSCK